MFCTNIIVITKYPYQITINQIETYLCKLIYNIIGKIVIVVFESFVMYCLPQIIVNFKLVGICDY